MRVDSNTQRGRSVTITVDGVPLQVYLGETIAAALLASGRRAWRFTQGGKPRGIFCGMGICFDCTLTVDGMPNIRACLTPVADGMVVETEQSMELSA